MGHFGVKKT
jgi:hypothetical protein